MPEKLTWIPKMNQNDGLEKVDSFKIWPFLVSMLDFWGVRYSTVDFPASHVSLLDSGQRI